MSKIFCYALISLSLLSCENDLVSNEDAYRESIRGTWQEVYHTRLDISGEISEEYAMDTVRIAVSSIFAKNIQKLIVDTLKSDFHFVLFYHYEVDEVQLTRIPDSLYNEECKPHYWDKANGLFNPYYPVLARIYSASLNRINATGLQETRILSNGTTLIIDYILIDFEPKDLVDNLPCSGTKKDHHNGKIFDDRNEQ